MTFEQKVESLRARQEELSAENEAILATASADKRELTADELKQLKANVAAVEELGDEVRTREQVAAQAAAVNAPQGRKTEPDPAPGARSDDGGGDEEHVAPRAQGRALQPRVDVRASGASADKGKFGFRFFGEFAQAVVRASATNGGQFDPRLDFCIRAAATTYGNEGVGEQGGFLVPPDFRTTIMEMVMGEETLMSRTDQLTTSGNSLTFPTDSTTPWQTTGGIQAYWDNEGSVINQSRPLLQQETIKLNRLTALVPVTEELLEDASAIDGYLRRKTPQKMIFKVNLAIVQGSGAGQPLGILNSPALVTVDAESGQTAASVIFHNFQAMWGRLYAPCRRTAVWLVNQDVETQLMGLSFPGTGTAVPVFLPPGGLRDAPYATLLGRPVIVTEAANEIGDVGDVILADLNSYLTVRKTTGIRVDTSMHLWFDQAITAFRFMFRMGGQPWWPAPITRRDGTNTLSCFVALAART